MSLDSRIYGGGHCGLVGSAIVRRLQREGCGIAAAYEWFSKRGATAR